MAAAAMVAAGGCQRTAGPADIQSADAMTRARALRQLAERRDVSVVPLLVDRLEDEDESVRFVAILSLERLTGQRFGYVYYRGPESQPEAIRRWREFARGSDGRASLPSPAAASQSVLAREDLPPS